jgi:transposase-like protein
VALAVQVPRMVTFEVRIRHSQKLKELERRRRRGARLLAAGESQAEVARQIGVSRQSLMRWDRAREEGALGGRVSHGVMDVAADPPPAAACAAPV